MDFKQIKTTVDSLNERAMIAGKQAGGSTDALRLSQAALNVANSYATLKAIQRG